MDIIEYMKKLFNKIFISLKKLVIKYWKYELCFILGICFDIIVRK
jgi:hypothetical protein